MSTWQYIIEQYGSPIKMKLQISELKRKLFNTIKDREDLREYSFELKDEIDKLKKEIWELKNKQFAY